MFIPARVIFFLALTAWGTAAFELSFSGFPLHFSAADLQNIEPFSDAATASERTAGNITFFGLAAGFVLFGFLSDRFGRCRILLLCLFLAPLCSGLGCISFSFSDFLILRFITGAASGGLFLTGTLLLYEQRDAMFRRNAPQFVPMLTLIMMMWFVLLPLIPVIHWRLSVAATFLPVFFLLYFYRYYDEPPRWKIAVRDKRFANRTAKKYGNIRERRKIVRGTFTLFAVIVILKIPFTDYFFPSLQSRESRIMIIAQQDGILAYLIQEPQLLNTEELGQLDWQAIGEKLTAQRDIPRALFDALLTLNAEKRTISRQNLLDRAVAAWDKHKGNRRKATEIPQNEVDAFYQKAGEYLDNTQNRWKDIGVFQESFQKYSSVSGIWKQRKEIFKKMLEDLQAGIRKYRYTAEWSQRSNAFYFYFFFSGWAFVPCVNPALILPRCFITSRRGRYCGVCAAAAVLAGLLCRMLS